MLPSEYPAVAYMAAAELMANPSMPPEATPYDLCLTPGNASQGLPDIEEVFEKLMARKQFVKEEFGFNLLHCTWVNFFLEDFFRTVHGGDSGAWVNRGHGLLSQVYGVSEIKTHALRSHEGGKMKVGQDGRLPRYVDMIHDFPNLSMRCHRLPGYAHDETCLEHSSDWFVCGDERCNTHPGFIFWSTVFVRHHNFVANLLVESHPDMSDPDLFEAARRINQWTMFKLVWEEYVWKMICAKDLCTVPLDPDFLHELGFTALKGYSDRTGPISMPMEFNQLYHWHQWIPDEIMWDDEGSSTTPFVELMWQPGAFAGKDVQSWAEAFYRTPMGHVQPQNYPRFLKPVFVKFLNISRKNRVKSYNEYRAFFGLGAYTDWEEFRAPAGVTAELKRLYGGDINLVEFQVGLWMDCAPNPIFESIGNVQVLSNAMQTMVGTFAMTLIANTPFVREHDYISANTLGDKGFQYAKGINLQTVLQNAGIHGLGSAPNELPNSWRPSWLTRAGMHAVVATARLFD